MRLSFKPLRRSPRPQLALAAAGVGPLPAPARRDAPRTSRSPSGACPSTRASIPFNRLILAVVLLNLGVLGYHLERADWLIDDGSALSALSSLTLVNLVAAVLIRQQNVLNVLFGLAGRGSRSWPLWLRWSVSKVHHVGGIHVGGALAGTAWLCAFTYVATTARARDPASVSATTLVLAYALVALVVLVVACAAPPVRSRAHNVFELSHRFGGWTSIALFWVLTVHLALRGRGGAAASRRSRRTGMSGSSRSLRRASPRPGCACGASRSQSNVCRRTPRSSGSTTASRLRSRRRSASAAARCANGTRSPPSRRPAESGFRLLVSRAGDWTGRFIDDPPVARLGPWHPGLGADGEGRAPLRARRLRRHRQRHRPLPRADPGRARPRQARLVDPRARATPTATPRRRGGARAARRASSGTRRSAASPTSCSSPARRCATSTPRRSSSSATSRPRGASSTPWSGGHPRLRADLGLLNQPRTAPSSTARHLPTLRPHRACRERDAALRSL